MKKLGIAFISKSDEKSVIYARHEALSSVILSLFASGALNIEEETLDSEFIKASASIMVDDAIKEVTEKDNMGIERIPRKFCKQFKKLFPYINLL